MRLLLGNGDRGQYFVNILLLSHDKCLAYYFTAVTADGSVYRLPGTGYYGTVDGGSNCHTNWLNSPVPANFTILAPARSTLLPLFGQAQGSDTFFAFNCPKGASIFYMNSSAIEYGPTTAIMMQCSSGETFSRGDLGAGCAYVVPTCATGYTGVSWVSPFISRCNGTLGTGDNSFDCPPGTVLSGIRGYEDGTIKAIRFACSPIAYPMMPLPVPAQDTIKPFSYSCPKGTFVSDHNGRVSNVVDMINVTCSDGETSLAVGGLGGCPAKDYYNYGGCATGYTGADLGGDSRYVSEIVLYCGSLRVKRLSRYQFDILSLISSSRCPSGSRITGITGTAGQYLVSINFTCANATASTTPARPPDITNPYEFSCSNGSYITNIGGRVSSSVDRIRIVCSSGGSFSTGGVNGDTVTGSDCQEGFTGASVAYRAASVFSDNSVNQQYVVKIVPNCNGTLGSPVGSGPAGNPFDCPTGSHLTGITGYSGQYVNAIHFVCVATAMVSPLLGTIQEFDTAFNYSCPRGGFITSLGGRASFWTTAIFVACSNGDTFSFGGLGGNAYIIVPDCPSGYEGVEVSYDSTHVVQMRPNCGGSLGKSPVGQSLNFGSVSFKCPAGLKLAGIDGYMGQYLSAIRFTCDQPLPPSPTPDLYVSPIFGVANSSTTQSNFFDFICPRGEYIVNFNGEAGSSVAAVSVGCSGGGGFTAGGLGWNHISNTDCQAGFGGSIYVAYSAVVNPSTSSRVLDTPHFIRQLLFSCNGPSSTSALGFSRFAAGGQQKFFACPVGMRVVGINGSSNVYLNSISFSCAGGPFKPSPLLMPGPTLVTVSPLFGNPDGTWFNFNCPAGEFVVNIDGIVIGAYGPQLPGRTQGALGVMTVACSDKRNFTSLVIPLFDFFRPKCIFGYTGVDIYYTGYYGLFGSIGPVCNGARQLVSYITDVPTDAFSCPPGQRVTGVTGYHNRESINSLSVTCGEGYPPIPVRSRSRALGTHKSYNLVEPFPDCYFKLGPEYCPRPFDGFQFDDVYMVSHEAISSMICFGIHLLLFLRPRRLQCSLLSLLFEHL